jgi:hypothetical protein
VGQRCIGDVEAVQRGAIDRRLGSIGSLRPDNLGAAMKPTDRIIYERGFGPGDGDSHVERVEPAMTVSPSPELVDRLRKRAEIRRQIPGRKSVVEGAPDRISDLLEEAADALESAQAKIARLTTALSWFDKHGEHLANDVSSGHSARGSAASEWMREDDADFRSDLREALANARAALKDSPNVGT